jgi:hypothetical protein
MMELVKTAKPPAERQDLNRGPEEVLAGLAADDPDKRF